MSMEDVIPSRPSSAHNSEDSPLQEGPTFLERPTLPDVLSNSAPPPWTLSAFTAYLSHNHCLENLEFTMDAERYRERHDAMLAKAAGDPITPESEDCKYVSMLWQRLINAYIVVDGPREINIPSDVRDRLLSQLTHSSPPNPEALNPAVRIIYNLMEESVLVSFLNEIPSTKTRPSNHQRQKNSESKQRKRGGSDSSTDKKSTRSKSSTRTTSPTSSLDIPQPRYEGFSKSDPTGRLTPASSYVRGNRAPKRTFNSSGDFEVLTHDSTGGSSPGREPMTPPNTPPQSDSGGYSPRARNDNTWKKMLGWKKKSSQGMRESRFPGLED